MMQAPDSSHRLETEMLLNQYLDSIESRVTENDNNRHQEDELLRTVDFLCGNTLDGALSILDGEDNITKLVSIPSERTAHWVKKASTSRARTEEYYFCIVPQSTDTYPIYFCSCRAFLERNRQPQSESPYLCKHLLAIRLMPSLKLKPSLIETVSDEDFANLMIQRLSLE